MTVGSMTNLQEVVTALDFSEVSFTDSIISDSGGGDGGLRVFEAEDSFISVSNVTLERNTEIEFIASARNLSTIILNRVEIIDTTAVLSPVSIFVFVGRVPIATKASLFTLSDP
jgi:hypothetical protein